MKSLQLGISYGMGVPSLAKGLNRHPVIATVPTILEMAAPRETSTERIRASIDRIRGGLGKTTDHDGPPSTH
jgi:hypothetical protein